MYYEGFSNKVLWPNFHYFPQYIEYKNEYWEAYKRVNEKFCDELVKYISDDDTIWVHDYQLLLLPEMIRKRFPKISIGYFNHIPFSFLRNVSIVALAKRIVEWFAWR